MEEIQAARIALRLLYVGAAVYYALHVYELLRYAVEPGPLAPHLAYLAAGLSVTAALTVRLHWLPALTLLIVEAFHPDAALILYLTPILVLGVSISHLHGALQGDPLRAFSGAAAALALYALPASFGLMVGFLLHEALAYHPPLTGDAVIVYSAVSSTLAFKTIVSAIILAFAYKAASSLIELIAAYYSRGEARRALRREVLEREGEGVVGFRGPQYGVLEWSVSTLLTLLVAPLLYPPISRLVSGATAVIRLQSVWVGLLSLLIATGLAWIPMRLITILLVRTPPIEYVRRPPSPAGALAVLALALLLLLGVPSLFGYDPVNIMVEAATGHPTPAADPAASLLPSPGEDYYGDLARILDLLARLFWGG